MSGLKPGFIARLALGIVDPIPMMFLDLPDRNIAVAGAFLARFAIGFLIPNTTLPLPGWLSGLLIALLLSLPDAIITGSYAPILGLGMVGGIVIGFIVNRKRGAFG